VSNETINLLSQLIQNACVNDGTINSGNESRSVETLRTFFNDHAVDIEVHGGVENRDSLVVRMQGKSGEAPSLLLMGHTDVVPATGSDWEFDPFGGEIKDGYVLGRGAVDMLNLTSSMAVALSNVIRSGFAPEGDVIFAAVADEEAGGVHGAGYLVENYPDLVAADYVITESGGIQMRTQDKLHLPVCVGEKGVHWAHIDVEGTPTHGSKPYRSDNALLKSAEIIDRFKNYTPPVKFIEGWNTFLHALGLNEELTKSLSDEHEVDDALSSLDINTASVLHACCHHTYSPNTLSAGTKVNTVADRASIGVDIRTLPGTTEADVDSMLRDVLGEYYDQVEITYSQNEISTFSPTDTELWSRLEKISSDIVGDAELIPVIAPFGTDARYFRRMGSIAYGYGLFSPKISYEEHLSMFHGRNERVDVESLDYSTQLFEQLIRAN